MVGTLPDRWGYLELSDAYPESVRTAQAQGVPLVRLPLAHLAPMTHPARVAEALETVVMELLR